MEYLSFLSVVPWQTVSAWIAAWRGINGQDLRGHLHKEKQFRLYCANCADQWLKKTHYALKNSLKTYIILSVAWSVVSDYQSCIQCKRMINYLFSDRGLKYFWKLKTMNKLFCFLDLVDFKRNIQMCIY
jgi:hypothetical protein